MASGTDDPAATLAKLTDRALGEDPAQGLKFSQTEYETALRVELDRGIILERATEQSGVDWVDASSGDEYDAVGLVPSRFFDERWSNLQQRIIGHMAYSDFVPVDVTGLTPDQIGEVEQFIGPLGPQVFIVGQ